MAKYNGRHVDIVSRSDLVEQGQYTVSSKELGTITGVKKSELIFTDEEKAKYLKEDQDKAKVDGYKTRASEDKRIATEKALTKKNQDELDAKLYAEMSAEEKASVDKAKTTPAKVVSQPVPQQPQYRPVL